MMQNNSVQYKGIDIVKFIMALFVVILHTHPFEGINEILNIFTADVMGRVAVPFFFVATGFLLEKQIVTGKRASGEILKHYLFKVLKLYCIWTVVYLPFIIYDKFIDSDGSFLYGLFTMVRDFFFVGSYAHLWYLPATVVGVVVVWFFRRYLGNGKTAVLLFLLFLAGLLTQSYFGLLAGVLDADGILWKLMKIIKKIMVTCRNGVFFGGLFIYMGTRIAGRNRKTENWKPALGFIVSLLLFAGEVMYLPKIEFVREKDMYLMLVPAAFFLMELAVRIEIKRETAFFRKMSMNIYFIHLIFKSIYRMFIGEYNENGICLFLFTLTGTLISAYLLYRVEELLRKRKDSKC